MRFSSGTALRNPQSKRVCASVAGCRTQDPLHPAPTSKRQPDLGPVSQCFHKIQCLTLIELHIRHNTSANPSATWGVLPITKPTLGISGLIHLDSP
jgi:hypothetical protein